MKTFKQHLTEGVNDPAIFKAIFLAGGPGSGKSFIAGKTGLPALGYRIVNSDDAFEAAMKKAGIALDPEGIFSDKGQELRGRAKRLTAKKQELYLKGRLGLVIDGTGRDIEKLKKQAKTMKAMGYDVAMIFVNTDKETALQRNRDRERSLPDAEVARMWEIIQQNIGAFQTIFGKKNFLVVDNSDGKDYNKETLRAYRDAVKFTNKEPETKVARDWIASQKKGRAVQKKLSI
jgi:shikimate kinase